MYGNAISRKHYTVNLWVRPSVLKGSHQGYIASRSKIDESSLNYEFSMKMQSGLDQFIPIPKGKCGTFKKDEWAMLTCVMDAVNGTRSFYFNGEFLEGDDNPYQLVQSGFKLTIGMGINHAEFAATGVVDCGRTEANPLARRQLMTLLSGTSVTMPEGAEWRVINTGIPPEKGEAYLRYDAANNRLQVETVGKGMLLIVR